MRIIITLLALLLIAVFLRAPAPAAAASVASTAPTIPKPTKVVATWYSLIGRFTASGERMTHGALTCAHKTLPFGTLLRVFNPENGKSVVVKVNDRGPVPADRHLDVSLKAAELLGFTQKGVTTLYITQLNQPLTSAR